jgi:hypothetical protein
MEYRNGIFATIALALSSVALAGIVSTDEYARAAQSEASGFQALTEQLSGGEALAGADAGVPAVLAPALLSSAPSDTVQQ